MDIIRLNNNRPLRRSASAAPAERRNPRWLLPAGYAGVCLLIIIALVFIARGQGSGNGQYAMFVANSTGGMAQMGSSSGQNLNPTSPSTGNAVANVVASAADQPSGSPTDPTHGQVAIIHDYAATGGPGNSGALDLGLSGTAAAGSPIHATHDGLIKTLRNNATYGNLVYVIGSGYTTIYGHLQSISVSDGQMIKRGDVIGTLGSSGAASDVYLNYQVWQCQGAPQASGTSGRTCVNKNPTDYLK